MECPNCGSEKIKLNGHIHNGKQNHRCKSCGRQFVLNSEQKRISSETKELINRLLLEKISLAGIARAAMVSEEWLSDYIAKVYAEQPDDLCAEIPDQAAMNTHLSERFDEYIYKVEALKKTLVRLSLQTHGRILRHLSRN